MVTASSALESERWNKQKGAAPRELPNQDAYVLSSSVAVNRRSPNCLLQDIVYGVGLEDCCYPNAKYHGG